MTFTTTDKRYTLEIKRNSAIITQHPINLNPQMGFVTTRGHVYAYILGWFFEEPTSADMKKVTERQIQDFVQNNPERVRDLFLDCYWAEKERDLNAA